jgi:hypothetical protein
MPTKRTFQDMLNEKPAYKRSGILKEEKTKGGVKAKSLFDQDDEFTQADKSAPVLGAR